MKIQLAIASTLMVIGSSVAQTFTNYTTTEGLASNNVHSLDIDASDNIWFGTQAGVSKFDGTNWTTYNTTSDPGMVDDNILAIMVASNGDVWIGSDFGASVYDGSSWTTYTTADGLGNNQIKCIFEDANGDIWFGTNNGVSEFDGTNWMTLGTADGLPFGGVTTIMEENGNIWLGSGLGGISIYDGSNLSFLTAANDGLIDNRMRAIVQDNQNNRWIGTSEGISVLNTSNTLVEHHTTIYTLPAPDTLNPIEDVVVDNSGNIWAGVYVDYLVTEGGVCAYDGNTWTEYHVSDGLVGPVIRALAVDSQNSIWIATSTGVSKLSDHGVSVPELSSHDFVIAPNPAMDIVNVQTNSNASEEVKIFNTSMQLVGAETTNSEGKVTFDLSTLEAGVYFFQVGNVTRKLLHL